MNPLKLFLLVATSIFLFGCAGGPIKTATKFTTYEDFQPGPDGGVDLVWARLGLRDADRLKSKLDDYDSVVIDQIFVLAEEGSLDQEEIQELTDHMVSRLEEKISPHKVIVDEPSGKTLRLSIALSNVETPNPILAVTSSVLPFGLAMSTISKVATGEHTNVGSASVELLVSDAQDGTPLFAAIDREAGNKDFSTMIDSLDDAKDAINYWVERLGDTLQNIDDAQKDRTMLEKENLIKLARMQMPFGKYAGRTLIDLPEEYLLWFDKKGFPNGELGDLLKLCLALKIEGLDSVVKPLKRM